MQIVLIIVATLIVNFFVHRSLKKLENHVINTENVWDDAVLHAAYIPIRLTGWLIGLTLILAVLHHHHSLLAVSSLLYQFRKIAFIVVLTLFLYYLIINIHHEIVNNKNQQDNEQKTKIDKVYEKFDVTSIEAISKLLRLSIIIVATLTILQVLGYSISGVLAFGGMGGVAVGFAAKDLLANFFGGLIIFLDKPFKVGDWIRSPDRDIEGVVEDIGWRISRIRTFDKRPLYIPNSLFTNIIVENPSRMTNRQIKENIGIRYDDWHKMEVIVQEVKKMLIAHPEIDSNQTLICNFNAFSDSSIDFFLYTFTKTTDWVTFHEIKQDVLFKIFNIIDDHDAGIAFPTQTLIMDNSTEKNFIKSA